MSQKDRVLQYLKQGKVLTRLNAWDEGHDIQTTMKPVLNRYGEQVRIAEWFI